VEAYTSDKMKYVVIFVCRILKETKQSNIFKANNPWIKAVLEIFREINEFAAHNTHQKDN
jgi:CCR4-NOT transcription complex subunit 1